MKVRLSRECSIELPLNYEDSQNIEINKDFNEGLFDVSTKYDEENLVMSYTIRKRFQAKLDGTYRQFFAPFNMINIQLVLKFSDTEFKNPGLSL